MTGALPAPPLLVITDRLSAPRDLGQTVSEIFQAGCRWLMVREKDLATDALSELTKTLVDQARPFDARVMVNGDTEAAKLAGAAGVHLQTAAQVGAARRRLGDHSLIGVSAHGLEEALAAGEAGADYITMSPVFLTDSKPGYGPALGISGLAAICRQQGLPVVALAGITSATASACLGAGAAAIAVMGSVMRADNPGSVVGDLLRGIQS